MMAAHPSQLCIGNGRIREQVRAGLPIDSQTCQQIDGVPERYCRRGLDLKQRQAAGAQEALEVCNGKCLFHRRGIGVFYIDVFRNIIFFCFFPGSE